MFPLKTIRKLTGLISSKGPWNLNKQGADGTMEQNKHWNDLFVRANEIQMSTIANKKYLFPYERSQEKNTRKI